MVCVEQMEQRRTSRLAVASTMCLITALLLILLYTWSGIVIFNVIASALFPASFIVGISACVFIAKKNELKGYCYAIAPICIGFVVTLVMFTMVFNVISRRHYEKRNTARYNMRRLGYAIYKYSEVNNGYLPSAEHWCDLLMDFDKSLSEDNFKHPKFPERVIAFNKNLDGLLLADVPEDVVLFFEANSGWNLSGGPALLTKV